MIAVFSASKIENEPYRCIGNVPEWQIQNALKISLIVDHVIVMTFWYVLSEWTHNFFELFNFILHLGLITNPHVLYVHMTYVYSFSHVSFFTRSHGQEKSLSYYDLLHDFQSSTLWTHPHPHFLLSPPQPHHPYTPRLYRSTTALSGGGHHPA